MSGFAIIAVAVIAGLLGAGFGLVVAFFVLRSRSASSSPSAAPAAAPRQTAGPTPDAGDPAAQSPLAPLGAADDDEPDDAIPTTVFRAEDLDIDALIAQAEKLKK